MNKTVNDVEICAFPNCQSEAEEDKEFLAAVSNVAKEISGASQHNLLGMYSHKYLPNEQILNFIEKGVRANGVKIQKVTNILKPHLVIRFEKKWSEMKNVGSPVRLDLAFHGTSGSNIDNIIEKGLLVPGKGNTVQHATDTGYWGKGKAFLTVIYSSFEKEFIFLQILLFLWVIVVVEISC